MSSLRLFLSLLLAVSASALAAEKKKPAVSGKQPFPVKPSPWGDFVEKDFPFFSSVVDARDAGEEFPKDNLTPRGIVLNLGHNLWACFDTDLLRIACIWEGEPGKPPLTPEALAPGSYHIAGQKTKDGQENLPKPIGKVWLANGIYPGWQVGDEPSFTDPREKAPSSEEVGRGAIEQFRTVTRKWPEGLGLEYAVDGVQIVEWMSRGGSDGRHVTRWLQVPKHGNNLLVLAGMSGDNMEVFCSSALALKVQSVNGVKFVEIPASETEIEFGISIGAPIDDGESASPPHLGEGTQNWPQTITTTATLSTSDDAYVIDDIPLPLDNPWKRNVRLADIAFLNDQGEAAAITFDGDVWLISGLTGDLEKITWKRFASGLHEPMSIVSRDGALLVFDRNGIWKLVDTNGDRECDRYEMFCNLFAQTAETREFPNSMKLGPDGALYISKGGQEGTTRGKHNGTVIKVAPDGKSFEVIGYGLRQPFIGVNPKTGLVTASDQQGHYVPSTPLHIIEKHHFYGHLPTVAPKDKFPEAITEPLTWIPHPVNPSGVTQTWLIGAKMGPLNDELIHIGYNRPELFRVLMNTRMTKPQAAVVSLSRAFDFPTLNALVNPADGQLYVIGFQVWGTTAKKISGLARYRYTGKPRVLLKEVTPTDKGLLLRFNEKLDPKLATDPSSYSAERWNYRRTPEYGSPHLKSDGTTGQEWMTPSSAYLSQDGKSVLVGLPDMKAGVHQMRIGWGLKSETGLKAENTAYFTPWELLALDTVKEGFGTVQVDLTPRAATTIALAKPTLEEGARLYQMIGCMACHSTDGTTVGKVGPSWKGLAGSERQISKGIGKVKADAAYLRESITNPGAKVVAGFEKFDTGMPIYAGILNESQIESLVLYIQSLK
jgi:mono/diheme cytochrome c family protein